MPGELGNSDIRNAKYNKDGSIDVDLNHPEYGWIPFTASPEDTVEHGRVIYTRALHGEAGEVLPYNLVTPQEDLSEAVRTERDHLLITTDWTQLPDVPEETKLLWAPYRQALRDVTEQEGFPYDIEWPVPPT